MKRQQITLYYFSPALIINAGFYICREYITRLYNFINDTLVAELTVLGH